MRILLINPPVREWAEPNIPPLGLLLLSSVLRGNGYDVNVMDVNGRRWGKGEVEKQIAEDESDVYGIGGLVTTYAYSMWLADLIKRHHPDKPVVCGGPLTTANPKILLKHVDAVVIGEGENAILDVVRNIEKGCLKKTYQSEPIKNLDNLLPPDYENLDTLPVYLKAAVGAHNPRKWKDGKPVKKVRTLQLLSGRGCPFNCHFCSSHYLGPRYRLRSVQNIIDEAKRLIEDYEVEYFHYCDELTTPSRRRCLQLCEEMGKLDVTWGCPVRIDLLDREQLHKMWDSGCIHIGTGIESFSPKMLRFMNKPMNVAKAKLNLRIARNTGFDIQYTLILGYPGESKETIVETVKGVKEVGFPPEQVFFPTPYPGTELYKYAVKQGYIKDEEKHLQTLSSHEQRDLLFNFTNLADEELFNVKEEILNGC